MIKDTLKRKAYTFEMHTEQEAIIVASGSSEREQFHSELDVGGNSECILNLFEAVVEAVFRSVASNEEITSEQGLLELRDIMKNLVDGGIVDAINTVTGNREGNLN